MLTLGHIGDPLAPHDVWRAWNLDPFVILALSATWWLYLRGAGDEFTRLRALFGWGLVVVAVAVLSPIDAMGSVLASAHMVQHLLLVMVAAPLIALTRPAETLILGIYRGGRKQLGRLRRRLHLTPAVTRRIAQPGLIWLAFAGVLWFWHLPGPYQAALQSDLVHAVEHLSFLIAAVLFWSMVFAIPEARRGLAVLTVFAAAFQSTLLAALLTFARSSWYPFYESTVTSWGLRALEDQQLAGVIMWVPGGLLYLAFGLWLFATWIGSSERASAGMADS